MFTDFTNVYEFFCSVTVKQDKFNHYPDIFV